jgi:hypothetical protein
VSASARVGRVCNVRVGRGRGGRQCSALTCGPSSAMRGQKHAVVEDSIPHTHACVVLLLAWPQRRSGSRSVAGCCGCVGGHVHADFCSVCVVFLVRFGHSAPQGLAPTTPVQTTRLPPLPPHHATANVARSCSLFGMCAPRGQCMSVIAVCECECVASPCTFMALAREEGGEMKAGRDGSQIRRSLRTSALRRRASPHSHSCSAPIASVSLFVIHNSRAKRIRCTTCARLLTFRA